MVISDLASGIYMILVETNEKIFSGRFVKR
jgi:hypothetical protein